MAECSCSCSSNLADQAIEAAPRSGDASCPEVQSHPPLLRLNRQLCTMDESSGTLQLARLGLGDDRPSLTMQRLKDWEERNATARGGAGSADSAASGCFSGSAACGSCPASAGTASAACASGSAAACSSPSGSAAGRSGSAACSSGSASRRSGSASRRSGSGSASACGSSEDSVDAALAAIDAASRARSNVAAGADALAAAAAKQSEDFVRGLVRQEVNGLAKEEALLRDVLGYIPPDDVLMADLGPPVDADAGADAAYAEADTDAADAWVAEDDGSRSSGVSLQEAEGDIRLTGGWFGGHSGRTSLAVAAAIGAIGFIATVAVVCRRRR